MCSCAYHLLGSLRTRWPEGCQAHMKLRRGTKSAVLDVSGQARSPDEVQSDNARSFEGSCDEGSARAECCVMGSPRLSQLLVRFGGGCAPVSLLSSAVRQPARALGLARASRVTHGVTSSRAPA